ncbi:hypothetical protein, partial [Salmonella enterica]|uniref:hypothetical protein n=1 Tax=Salmonella enterica TaxID=28901 RepID=UPI00398C62B7
NEVHQRGAVERAYNLSDQHNGVHTLLQLNRFGLTQALLYRDVPSPFVKPNARAPQPTFYPNPPHYTRHHTSRNRVNRDFAQRPDYYLPAGSPVGHCIGSRLVFQQLC